MSQNDLHFLYVPDDERGVRSIRVRRWWAYGALGALGVLVGGLVLCGSLFFKERFESGRLEEVRGHNQELYRQLDHLGRRLAELEVRMQHSFDFERKARHLAGLDPLDPGVIQVGVGGPEPAGAEAGPHLSPESLSRMVSVKGELGRLGRQAELLTYRYGEIIESLEEDATRRDRIPSIHPVRNGFISSRFGRRMDPFTGRLANHYGVDFCARRGSLIRATADGVVISARRNGSFGNIVEIDHGNGYVTRYAHAKELLVRRGQKVKRGDAVATVGLTGRSTAPHVHYEIRRDGRALDPLEYMLPEDTVYD
jgi:murein DD-endopeptidase MepM/ murein hydrolase activator NlpD